MHQIDAICKGIEIHCAAMALAGVVCPDDTCCRGHLEPYRHLTLILVPDGRFHGETALVKLLHSEAVRALTYLLR